MRSLGQILVDRGLISLEELHAAEAEQRASGRRLGRVLVDQKSVTEKDLVAALATQIGMTFVDLEDTEVDARATTLLSEKVMRRYGVLPIGFEDGRLVVAMSDPANVVAVDDVRTMTKMEVKAVVATKDDLSAAIGKYASMGEDIEAIAEGLAGDQGDGDLADLEAVTEDAPIVKFVNVLITQAVADGASDIHIEPGERELRVRYRIDGVLHEVMKSPRSIQNGVISRLKIMADVDIAERRIP
ncbi:MAG: type II secretion system protein GspE, partial [Nitriliruptor sp.]